MRLELILVALLVAAPAAYAWWSGRAILRSLEDPALAELLHARQRRMAQVTVVAIVASAVAGASLALSVVTLLALLVAQYPVRRAVFGESWSLVQYVRYATSSFVGSVGLVLLALLAPTLIAQLLRGPAARPSAAQLELAIVLGAACGIVVVLWHRWFTRLWLALHRASPLERESAHAALLPRFHAVLDRAGDRLATRPAIHRYGAPGGRMVNAIALCSLHEPAVAMSDTLLDTLDADEATAIFAHEIAHHEHHDARRLRARRGRLVVVALLVAVLPAVELLSGAGLALVANLTFVLTVLVLFARGQTGKRAQETASDLRALELTDDPDALIRALTRIHVMARVPRRWAQEIERAATHPSLARRIQAIRERATLTTTPIGAPTIVASTTAGAYVALDDARAYWLDGVPEGTPLDLSSLREHATSYRAMRYGELAELRLVATQGHRALRASDLAGHSWSVDVRDGDVAVVQAALDAIDSRLGARPAEPVARNERVARVLAAALLLATLLGGGSAVLAIPALVTMLAPTTASLAAMGVMATAGVLGLMTGTTWRPPADVAATLLAAALGLWSAWIAWSWYRAHRTARAGVAERGTRVMLALLALVALGTLLFDGTSTSSPRELVADGEALSFAIALCGLGAALLVRRARAWRVAGAGSAVLGVAALVATTMSARIWPAPSAIGWAEGRLSLVATVPLRNDVNDAELSPGGTRYLTRRAIGGDDADDDGGRIEIATGGIAPAAPRYAVEALDAVLPNETEMLVLAQTGDSVELRLERVEADSAQRVAWRRSLGRLSVPAIRVLDGGARWQVSGRLGGFGQGAALVTLDGALDGADVRRTEVPADSLRGQTVFTYRDGSTLVLAISRDALTDLRLRSTLWSMLAAMRGGGVAWSVWRHDRAGSHLVTRLRGYVRCSSGSEDDVAVCVDLGRRGAHVLSIAATGRVTDLGVLSRSDQRTTASRGGQVVVSSYRDRSLAVVDVARRRGVRAVLPGGDFTFTRDASATANEVAVVQTGPGGSRLIVYRLEAVADRDRRSALSMSPPRFPR